MDPLPREHCTVTIVSLRHPEVQLSVVPLKMLKLWQKWRVFRVKSIQGNILNILSESWNGSATHKRKNVHFMLCFRHVRESTMQCVEYPILSRFG